MEKRVTRVVLVAAFLLGTSTVQAVPMLQSLAPVITSFDLGLDADFVVAIGSGFGDVTAAVEAVDLTIPTLISPTSGCEASDFAGFIPGSIALIQRGSCAFSQKTALAEAAGATGVLIFNDGISVGRMAPIPASLGGTVASVPVFFTSYNVGEFLSNGVEDGGTGFTVRMSVSREDLLAPVPEPTTTALLALGLLGAGWRRRAH